MRNKLKVSFVLAFGVCFGSSFWVASAANITQHTIGTGSVDSKEIRWGSNTQYTTYRDYAIKTWNALGKVNIAPDNSTSIEDLRFTDVNLPDEDFTAQWVPKLVTDDIQFNTPKFAASGRTSDQKKKTATHELGHGLGLGDHYESTYSGIVMYGTASSTTTLQPHDKTDYEKNW